MLHELRSIKINPDKIREVIGKGGETIQKITAETGTEIDIKDDGTVMIASPDKASIEAAKQMIQGIVAEPEVGKIYKDKPVVSVMDFGAFVQIMPGKDGLVHVSEMSEERVEKPSDVVKEGDIVTVKLVAIDDRGRLQLSMKAATRELKGIRGYIHMNARYRTLLALLSAVILVIGFRLVTQAGQPWPLIQNDGYAVSGGLVILLSGMIIGWLFAKREK